MPSTKLTKLQLGLIVLFAVLLLLPSLKTGLIADDVWHALWMQDIEQNPAQSTASIKGLFSFASPDAAARQYLIERGGLPWWAADNLTVNFWRPLAELSHWDYRYLLDKPIWLHVHSLLWYIGLLLLLAAFYQRVLPKKSLVIYALLVVVTEPFHALSVTWLANRNIIMAGCFVLASLIFYHDYRQTAQRWRIFAALFSYLLALLCSEAATSALAILIAYALFLDKQPRRFSPAIGYFILSFVWFIAYKLMGYGASGDATMYVDPVGQPQAFISQFFQRIPIAFAMQLLVYPKLFPEIFTQTALVYIGLALFSLAVGVAAYFRHRLLAFCLTAFLICIVPLASALLHERNFIFVSIVLAPIVALLLDFLWQKKGVSFKTGYALLLGFKVILSSLLVVLAIAYFAFFINGQIQKTIQSLPDSVADQTVILLGTPILHSSFIYPTRKLQQQVVPDKLYSLFSEQKKYRAQRLDEQTWQFEFPEGMLSEGDYLLRDLMRQPFAKGQVFELSGLAMSVGQVDDKNNITVLTVTKQQTSEIIWLVWQDNRFQTMPLVIGEEIILP